MVTPLNNRKLLGLKGSDCKKFLQNLISNDINLIDDGLVYSALLTPQGKYVADFLLYHLKMHSELMFTQIWLKPYLKDLIFINCGQMLK